MGTIRIKHYKYDCWFTWDESGYEWEKIKDILVREISQTGFEHFGVQESLGEGGKPQNVEFLMEETPSKKTPTPPAKIKNKVAPKRPVKPIRGDGSKIKKPPGKSKVPTRRLKNKKSDTSNAEKEKA